MNQLAQIFAGEGMYTEELNSYVNEIFNNIFKHKFC